MKNLLKFILISAVCFSLVGCSKSDQGQISTNSSDSVPMTPNQNVDANSAAGSQSVEANTKLVSDNSSSVDEDLVTVNVSNFGRSNPFQPFRERSLTLDGDFLGGVPGIPAGVPQPPAFSPDPNISTLLGIKVAGILYDSHSPSAIINVDGNDYLVHKKDSIFNFYVSNITADKVTIKTGNNVYSAGIGEIIEGVVSADPVSGSNKFAGSQKLGSIPEIKLVNPTYLPSLD